MFLYRTTHGILIKHQDSFYTLDADWDILVNRNNLFDFLLTQVTSLPQIQLPENHTSGILPPIGTQEVWAAGVTYFRSKQARMEEASSSGSASFYDLVYEAKRPELFFKAPFYRVAGHLQGINIRRDAHWQVPEPELALFVNRDQEIVGYTIGNDVSARDIEAENPLYLPQAKTYDFSVSLGPCLWVSPTPISLETSISLHIYRNEHLVFEGQTQFTQLKRTFTELVSFLFHSSTFPTGCYLLTGTGIVPPDEFSLQPLDVVEITIEPIGTLRNRVNPFD